MSFNIFCKDEDTEPKQPEGGGRTQCGNCANKIRQNEIDEPTRYKWKKIPNYPQDRSCPDCGEPNIHVDPRNAEQRRCQFKNERHGMYCCRCGTWMYKVTNVDVDKWKCPNESCSFMRLG